MSKIRAKRSDAVRSAAAIIDAAVQVLGSRPAASMEEIAAAAGVARQTVYAHFPSREALVEAAVDRVAVEVGAELDAATLESMPATEALLQLLTVSWRAFERYQLLMEVGAARPDRHRDARRHVDVLARLEGVVRRGQRTGEIDPSPPPRWLASAVVALGHAAGESVLRGELAERAAERLLRESVLRLVAPSA